MSTATRYHLAWNYIWEGYKPWKRLALIDEIQSTGMDGRFFNEFITEVRQTAEGEEDIPKVKSNYVLTKEYDIVASGSFND
jgi:hypothetical protein